MIDIGSWLIGLLGGWLSTESEAITVEPPEPLILEHKQPKSPLSFSSFVGNKETVGCLQLAIKASQKENKVLPHILIYGQPGLGKTTLAKIIAEEMNKELIEITGSTIKSQADLLKILMDIDRSDGILFIDEIHSISKSKDLSEDSWLPLLQDFIFLHNLKDKNILFDDKNYLVASNKATSRPFTVIGATTDPGDLTDAFRERFPINCVLYPYNSKDLEKIIGVHAEMKEVKISKDAIVELAKRSRANPRIAINQLRNCYDRAVVENDYMIDKNVVLKQMKAMGINNIGMTRDDISVLKALFNNSKGLGVKSLAGVANLRQSTIENMVEPFLKREGFMITTHRRFITDKGKKYLKDNG